MKSMKDIADKVLSCEKKTIAVAAAADPHVLEAIRDAVQMNLANALLIGDGEKIEEYMKSLGLSKEQVTIVDEKDDKKAAALAVQAVREDEAQVLMKGLIGTADFMRAVLNKEHGLRTGKELTHVAVFDSPKMDRLVMMSDSAMHTYPDLDQKVKILDAIKVVGNALEIECPKVAIVCAVEVVNPAMQPTVDAAILSKMCERGQIKGVEVDGPLALDLALSKEAAGHKGVAGNVAGCADAVLFPNIETGNVMWKTLAYMSDKCEIAGTLVGAKAPLVLTSRSDSPATKLNSIMLSLII